MEIRPASSFVYPGMHEREKVLPGNIHHSHAVGPPDAHTRLSGDSQALILQKATFGAGLGKAGAFNDDMPDAAAGALVNDTGDRRCRHNDNGQIHRVGNIRNLGKAGQVLNLFIAGIDRIDGSLIT